MLDACGELGFDSFQLAVLAQVQALIYSVNLLTEELDLRGELVIAQARASRIYFDLRALRFRDEVWRLDLVRDGFSPDAHLLGGVRGTA